MPHVSLRDGQVEYRWSGPPLEQAPEHAPVLVFLHEGLGSVGQWRDFPDRLAAATGCAALVYSRFGYGQSDPCPLPRPLHFHTDEAVLVLPELLERLGVERCLLVGHSDGATIALIYAARAAMPGLLGVIAEAPHVCVEDLTVTGIAAVRERYGQGLREALARHHGANVDVAFEGWAGTWLHPGFRDWTVEAMVPEIRVPLLVIQGRQDEYASLHQAERVAAQAGGPAEMLVVEDCGHTPHREQAALVEAAMAGFIGKIIQR